jgi:hypothetical protein
MHTLGVSSAGARDEQRTRASCSTLEQALHDRRPLHRGGLVHHSDRGSQGRFKRSSQHGLCGLIEGTGQAPLRVFAKAFEALGGVPAEILYDRMKTAVTGPADEGGIAYNAKLLDMAAHYDFVSRACKPYRAKAKGKVERPFGYIHQDFFLAGRFGKFDDFNTQLDHWLAEVANARVHATTRRVVSEAFEEQPALKALPAGPYRAVLKLERRVSHEGMVPVGGNLYSVPDATRRRVLEVHSYADEIRIFEAGWLIAVHAVLEGRHRRVVAAGHRRLPPPANSRTSRAGNTLLVARAGEQVGRRPLALYDAVGRRLAAQGGR